MGNSTKKIAHTSFLHSYDIIQTNQQEHIKFLQHKTTQQEYLLKQLTFNNIKECHKTMDKLTQLKMKLNGNKNVVELKEFLMSSDEQYCGTFYKIYVLFQYPMRTLDDEIGERRLQRKSFSQAELWSILASCVAGLSHLQKNGIRHEALKSRNIILSHEGIIKISDPSILNLPTNYQSMLTKRNTKHIYPSPQQIQSLQQELISPTYNTYKNDVFTLGMIMLQTALLEYQDDQCYANDRHRIRWEAIEGNVNRVGKSYGEQIKNMIAFMLVKQQKMRPDWFFLQQNCMESGLKKRDSIVSIQTKKQRSNLSSQKFSINSNIGKNLEFGSTPQINRLESLQNINPHFIKIDTSRANQERVSEAQPIFQQSMYQLPKANVTFGTPHSLTNPHIVISPMKVVSGFQSSPEAMPHLQFVERHPHGFSSRSVIQLPPSRSTIPLQQAQQQFIPTQVRPHISIPPLKPSIIEQSRPLRNIFPSDQYRCRTKIDDNILKVQSHQKALKSIITEQKSSMSYGSSMPQNRNFATSINTQYRTNQPFEPQITSYSTPTSAQVEKTKDNQNLFQGFGDGGHQNYQETNSPEYVQNGLQLVSQHYELGSRYEGQKLNGLRHGLGRFYYQDGGMYDGEWKQDKMHGYGKLYYQSDKLAYEGEWINDQFSGRGTIYNEQPEILERGFNYRNFDDLEEYWVKYEGQFINDSKYGRGVLYLSNGQKFDGYFKADYVQGPGTFYCKDGTPITGTWSQNRKIA